MDRYITITKRKSSPRSAKYEPNPKQPKNSKVNQNRFALLDNTGSENTSATTTKTYKPPPLYIREPTSDELVKKLSNVVGKENFYVVSLRKGNLQETKVQLKDENNYRKVITYLDAEGKNYYTYQLKSAKGLTVIIKGIDSSVPIKSLHEALESEGYEVKSVHNIIDKNKFPQPLFRVEIAFNSNQLKKGNTHPIYDLKYLLNRRISVEEPHKRKGPLQCHNCQEFGHTKSFCKLPPVCVRCGDIHKSLECPHSKNDSNVLKCNNCGQKHTANYRGCEVYLRLKEKTTARRPEYPQYQNSTFPSLPHTSKPQNVNVQVTGNQYLSYASILKKNTDAQENNKRENKSENYLQHESTQSSIDNLIQVMNRFMTSMENMMQQMLQNQNMLMQILINKQ